MIIIQYIMNMSKRNKEYKNNAISIILCDHKCNVETRILLNPETHLYTYRQILGAPNPKT